MIIPKEKELRTPAQVARINLDIGERYQLLSLIKLAHGVN